MVHHVRAFALVLQGNGKVVATRQPSGSKAAGDAEHDRPHATSANPDGNTSNRLLQSLTRQFLDAEKLEGKGELMRARHAWKASETILQQLLAHAQLRLSTNEALLEEQTAARQKASVDGAAAPQEPVAGLSGLDSKAGSAASSRQDDVAGAVTCRLHVSKVGNAASSSQAPIRREFVLPAALEAPAPAGSWPEPAAGGRRQAPGRAEAAANAPPQNAAALSTSVVRGVGGALQDAASPKAEEAGAPRRAETECDRGAGAVVEPWERREAEQRSEALLESMGFAVTPQTRRLLRESGYNLEMVIAVLVQGQHEPALEQEACVAPPPPPAAAAAGALAVAPATAPRRAVPEDIKVRGASRTSGASLRPPMSPSSLGATMSQLQSTLPLQQDEQQPRARTPPSSEVDGAGVVSAGQAQGHGAAHAAADEEKETECCVCFNDLLLPPGPVRLFPCKHKNVCATCAFMGLNSNECPMCREPVQRFMRLHDREVFLPRAAGGAAGAVGGGRGGGSAGDGAAAVELRSAEQEEARKRAAQEERKQAREAAKAAKAAEDAETERQASEIQKKEQTKAKAEADKAEEKEKERFQKLQVRLKESESELDKGMEHLKDGFVDQARESLTKGKNLCDQAEDVVKTLTTTVEKAMKELEIQKQKRKDAVASRPREGNLTSESKKDHDKAIGKIQKEADKWQERLMLMREQPADLQHKAAKLDEEIRSVEANIDRGIAATKQAARLLEQGDFRGARGQRHSALLYFKRAKLSADAVEKYQTDAAESLEALVLAKTDEGYSIAQGKMSEERNKPGESMSTWRR